MSSFDFISLATESSPHRWRRYLEDVTGDEDDIATPPVGTWGQQSNSGSTVFTESSPTTITNDETMAEQPFFSQTTEAELYMLATNFLLYVSLVIITVIVAQIYFPESLQRHPSPDPESSRIHRAKVYNYRRRNDLAIANKTKATISDWEASGSATGTDQAVGPLANGKLEEEEMLQSEDEGEEVDNNEAEQFLDHEYGDTYSDCSDDRETPSPIRTGLNRTFSRQRSSSIFEFSQESLSKVQVLRRLVFCSLMLNLTFVCWGALQERMLTRRYPRYTGEYFTYSYALVFTNRFWTLIMSGALMMYLKPRQSRSTLIYEYSFPSISNMLSSWCQYEALKYVSFPATTLFKSFKLAPVMLMGKLLGNKSYPQHDYVVALMIGVGIAMFMTSTDDLNLFGYNYLGTQVVNNTAGTGLVLLTLFLVLDSFTSQFQSRMFQRHRDLSMIELMFATSAFSTVLSFVTLVHDNELAPALKFVMNHSEIHLHFLLFSICSTIGQLFIFYTIKNFGAVVFTLIMTTRILLSIGLSCVLYGHQITATGMFGLLLVMSAVLYRIRLKAQGQQLLKWQGMDDNDAKAQELVQEWHEHVDM